MLRLIVFLIVAFALAGAAVWLAESPGAVSISWRGYEVSTSFAILLAAVAAVAIAVTLLFELYRWLRGVPRRVRTASQQRRTVRGYEAINRGLIAAASGDRVAAQYHNREATRLLPDRPGALLLAAQTAQLDGRDDEAHRVFRTMLADPTSELLGLRGLLAQAMKSGDRAEALDLASRAYRLSPRTPWVLQSQFELLTRAERWQEALAILDGLEREKLIEGPVLQRRKAILLHMLAQEHRRHDRPDDALNAGRRAVKAAPGFTPAALLVSEVALERGRPRAARRSLELAWGAEPTPEIARAWLSLNPNDNAYKRYGRLRPLQRMRPDHVETQMALAEVALAGQRFDTARQHLERAERSGGTARTYRLLAEVERAAGSPERAEAALNRANDARPDRTWVVDDTGDVVPSWAPFGPDGTFDSIHWAEPPRLSQLTVEHRTITHIDEPPPPPSDSMSGPARPATPVMADAAP